MSQINQSIQQAQLKEPTNILPETKNHNQTSSDNPIISVDSSQEFRNIDTSQSQEISASFNTLTDSKSQETSNKIETSNQRPEQKIQQSPIQQLLPEVQEYSKPQQPLKQQIKLESNIDDQTSKLDFIQYENCQNENLQKDQTAETKKQQKQIKIQQKKPPQPTVDYEAIVSLKIFQNKINESLELKNQGNQFYKANQYQQAVQKYSQGLAILDPQQFYGATHAQCQKMAQVSASLLYNIGMCFFNMNSWKQAEVYFNQTILINPNHIKALHRRALCRYNLKNYQAAMDDIKQAFNKDRRNAQVHESYEKILKMYNQQLKKQKESMKEISTKIFRKQSQNSASVSPQKQQNKDEQQNKEEEHVKQSGQEPSSVLWDLAPLVLVAGAALFYGYKKFFGK